MSEPTKPQTDWLRDVFEGTKHADTAFVRRLAEAIENDNLEIKYEDNSLTRRRQLTLAWTYPRAPR